MQKLINSVKKLKHLPVREMIDKRMTQFSDLGKKGEDHIFSELCFCLLTANFNAERTIKIQDRIGKKFHILSPSELAKQLKLLGHRFPNTRARFIYEARGRKSDLMNILKNLKEDHSAREWLAKEIKGLGYKESSHFLRNIGRNGCAIIDFHIIDLLARHGLVKKYNSLTRKNYLEVENVLKKMASKLSMSLGELDLYLWYMETNKVLK